MSYGFLLVLEGIDGVGKTTLSKSLNESLTRLGYSVVLSREPTNGLYGQKIRESAKAGRLPLEEELNLFVEDRKEHIEKIIRPALNTGKIVILDRYYFSTMAYQGARGASMEKIARIHNEFAIDPNLIVLLQIDVDKALSRIAQSREGTDLFENKEYLQKVSDHYESIIHPNIFKVDANQPPEKVNNIVFKKILDCVNHAGYAN
jgi:dTMP kinase